MSGQGKKGQTHSDLLNSLEKAVRAFQAGPKVEFDSDLRWNEVEGILDIWEKLIEKEKGRDSSDDVADLEWFDPVRCEDKADRFMKWLKIDNEAETRVISMVVNESKSRYELWLNPNRAANPNEILFSVPDGTFMTGGAAAQKFKLLGLLAPNDMNMFSMTMMFIIFEKYVNGEQSTWKPFIDVLPSMRYFNYTFDLTRQNLAFQRSCPSLYCEALDNWMYLWLRYCGMRKRFTELQEKNLMAKALGKVLTYKRFQWAFFVVAINSFNDFGPMGQDGEVTGIIVRHIPYNNDSTQQQPIFIHSTVDGPYLQFGLIPFMDMCSREIRKQHGANTHNFLIPISFTLGATVTPFPLMKTGVCFWNYLILYDVDVGNYDFNEESYNLSLNLVKNTTGFNRRHAALNALGLTSQETFKLKPKIFLNRTVQTDEEMLIYKKLFTFVHVYMTENELLDRLDRSSEGDDLEFLTVPSKEAWTFLAERFDLLHKLAEESLERMDNLWGNHETLPTNSREKECRQYMEKEKNCLARFMEILMNRRDKDPTDEPPGSLHPDEDPVETIEKAICAFETGPNVQFESDLRWKEVEGMFDILGKLIEKEKGIDSSDDVADLEWFDPVRCEEKANSFMKWLQIDNDPETRTISMVVNESKSRYELWLNPNRAPNPNEILFSVPAGTFMTGGNAAQKFRFSGINIRDPGTNSFLMVLFLLFEKYVNGEESTWKPFIDVLPSIRYTNSNYVFTREDLAFRKSSRGQTLDNLMTMWTSYCLLRKSLTILQEENLLVKALVEIITYKRYLWAISVVALSSLNSVRIGQDGEETGITIRLIPYNNDSIRQPIFLCSTVDGPYFEFGLIPFMDMCPARDVEEFANRRDFLIQLGPTLGDSETPSPLTKSGVCSSNYLVLYDDADNISKPGLDEGTYNLNLNLVKNKTFFNRRQAALQAHGLTSQATFELRPKFFLNRTVKTDHEKLIYKKLFTFVHIYLAENKLLDRIERSTEEGDNLEFLTVPSKEAWACLADRFYLLHKIAERSLNRLDDLWENRDELPMNSREKKCRQYMEEEINYLARFTEIVTNRRDNDPTDELPSSLNPDENLVELSEETKALSFICNKKVYGPVSFRRLPTPGTPDDPTCYLTNPSA